MKFLEELESVLKGDERFVSKEGQLLKPRVRDAVSQLDAKLIRSIVASPLLREHFFKNVDDITIFDQEKFMWVVNSKEFLPDSYTAYKNKIGLSANDHDLLTSSNEVALVWPYKDCVLEGGQDKEDEKRDEVFYNEILAPDEVTRLLAPKALCNATRYTADGEETLAEFDEQDNLLIKGNNLLALSSLLMRYEGQVKCIYIDPPYNTGSDSFSYNDRFNHSSWLIFMRNRLELAKRLLRPDGVVFIQCDDNEQAYLKVLADEIFDRDNFVGTLVHQRAKGGGQAKHIVKGHDYVTIFAKDLSREHRFVREAVIQKAVVEIGGVAYLRNDDIVRKRFGKYDKSEGDRRCFFDELETYKTPKQIAELEQKLATGDLVLEDFGNGRQVFVRYTPVKDTYSKLYSIVKALGETATSHLRELEISFPNPKPEELLEFLLSAVTEEGDLVLDFFLGSGTTAAVAHKMGRRYIGIEQMDYVSSVTIPRLQKVIAGEQGGISEAQEWKGGGSFVYVELAEQGEQLMSELRDATTTDEVQAVLSQATNRGLLRPSVLPDALKKSASEFAELSFDDQKLTVADLIDKNRLYVNASDIEDADFGLSVADVSFTKSFYRKGE